MKTLKNLLQIFTNILLVIKLLYFSFYNYKINIYDITSRNKKLVTSPFFSTLLVSVFKTRLDLPIQPGTNQ